MPRPGQSARWVSTAAGRKLRVELAPGDDGKCSSDARSRNGSFQWERAELKQTKPLPRGKRYEISFELTLEQGFTGARETFFQLQSWSKSCRSAPPVLLQMDNRRLEVELLGGLRKTVQGGAERYTGRHTAHRLGRLTVKKMIGVPLRFDITFDATQTPARVSIAMQGKTLVKNEKVDIAPCVEPALKFGIYRPSGGAGRKLSAAMFDNIQVRAR